MRRRKRNRRRTANASTRSITRRAPAATTLVITNKGVLKQLRIRHKEMVKDIDIPATSGVLETFEINPGLEAFFPWLSQIAQRFETYRFNSFKVHYVTSVPTSTSGTLAICPDYDAADDNSLATKKELMAFEDSTRGAWWSNFTMTSTPANLRKKVTHFIRGQALASNLDIKTYDVMQLHLHKSGAVAEVGGELWVEYDITLYTPQMKHEAEALQQTGAESDFTVDSTDTLAVLSDITNKLNAYFGNSPTYGNYFGVETPGCYQVSVDSDIDETMNAMPGTPTFWAYDAFRDASWDGELRTVDSVNNAVSVNGVLEVYETGISPVAPVWLVFGGTPPENPPFYGLNPSSGTNTYRITLYELLPASGRRAAYRLRNRYAKMKRARGEKPECYCSLCVGVLPTHHLYKHFKHTCKLRDRKVCKLKSEGKPLCETASDKEIKEIKSPCENMVMYDPQTDEVYVDGRVFKLAK